MKKTDKEIIKKLYNAIILPRLIEEKMLNLLRQGKISKWFSGIGQEAISVGVAMALRSNDTIFTMHRNLGVFTARNIKTKGRNKLKLIYLSHFLKALSI